jgi:hypothetical protein
LRLSRWKGFGEHLQNFVWTFPGRKTGKNHDPDEQPAKQAGANLDLEGLPLAGSSDAETRGGIKHTPTIKPTVSDVD